MARRSGSRRSTSRCASSLLGSPRSSKRSAVSGMDETAQSWRWTAVAGARRLVFVQGGSRHVLSWVQVVWRDKARIGSSSHKSPQIRTIGAQALPETSTGSVPAPPEGSPDDCDLHGLRTRITFAKRTPLSKVHSRIACGSRLPCPSRRPAPTFWICAQTRPRDARTRGLLP